MGDPISSSLLAGGAGVISFLGANRAAEAQEQQAEYQSHLLDIQAKNANDARITNSRRKREDKERYLARVRLEQANSGGGMSGTNQLVFDEITSRLDERIADMNEASLAEVGRIRDAGRMSLYQGKQNAAASRLQGVSSLISAGAQGFKAYNRTASITPPRQNSGGWSLFS